MALLHTIFLFTVKSYSQPGPGGGGLKISGFYNRKLEKINIYKDSLLKVRTFSFQNGQISGETDVYRAQAKEYRRLLSEKKNPELYRATGIYFNDSYYFSRHSSDPTENDQRLCLIYEKDTMIVDFYNIMEKNIRLESDEMDSLVLQAGHYVYYRNRPGGTDATTLRLMRHGLTYHTLKQLMEVEIIDYKGPANTSFLQEDGLSCAFLLMRADAYLRNGQTEQAFRDIFKATEKEGYEQRQCQAKSLLLEAYKKSGEYEKAIEILSFTTRCYSSGVRGKGYYETRADLYNKSGKFKKALADLDSMVMLSNNNPAQLMERARFKLNRLKDYKGAASDLQSIIATIPDDYANDRLTGKTDDFSYIYFLLGLSEYYSNDMSLAFEHWMKAAEFGYEKVSPDYYIIHFDSLIRKHPNVPELYYARAVAQLDEWLNEDALRTAYLKAFSDLDMAEKKGSTDFRINLYRARLLIRQEKYKAALEQANIVISKNKNDPRAYAHRSWITYKLGHENPDDLKTYRELSKQWKFPK